MRPVGAKLNRLRQQRVCFGSVVPLLESAAVLDLELLQLDAVEVRMVAGKAARRNVRGDYLPILSRGNAGPIENERCVSHAAAKREVDPGRDGKHGNNGQCADGLQRDR